MNDDSVTDPVVRFENVSKEYETNQSVLESVLSGREQLTAVNDVSFVVRPGETLGIVGESGSGKSTIAELMTGLSGLTSGTIRLNGQPVGIAEDRSHDQLNDVGMVFRMPGRVVIQDFVSENWLLNHLSRQAGHSPNSGIAFGKFSSG